MICNGIFESTNKLLRRSWLINQKKNLTKSPNTQRPKRKRLQITQPETQTILNYIFELISQHTNLYNRI